MLVNFLIKVVTNRITNFFSSDSCCTLKLNFFLSKFKPRLIDFRLKRFLRLKNRSLKIELLKIKSSLKIKRTRNGHLQIFINFELVIEFNVSIDYNI